ncbi:MAG TPA: ribbon-helix-helix protein, CopG family [Anaerolineales bacterium]|nr:ribbon-helix-helix protein, CopG family [Anaerolineales bacterium]
MIRTQIQLTEAQNEILKHLAAREGKSVAELVRQGVDQMIRSRLVVDPAEVRRRAIAVVGKFHSGNEDLSAEHDRYAAEAYES